MRKDWKVYIRGNKDRGEEVIKALTDLGGNNRLSSLKGSDEDWIYFINSDGEISSAYLVSEIAKIIMDNYCEIKLPEKWKKGDILIRKKEEEIRFVVFDRPKPDLKFCACLRVVSMTNYFDYVDKFPGGGLLCEMKDFQLATSQEVKRFYDLLHKQGKTWNSKKMKLVDWKWKPKNGETYWVIDTDGYVRTYIWNEDPTDDNCFNFGNCFKTREEAEAMMEKIRKLLKGK